MLKFIHKGFAMTKNKILFSSIKDGLMFLIYSQQLSSFISSNQIFSELEESTGSYPISF